MPAFDTPDYYEWKSQQDLTKDVVTPAISVLSDASAQEFKAIMHEIVEGRMNRAEIEELTSNFPKSRFEEPVKDLHPFPVEGPLERPIKDNPSDIHSAPSTVLCN